MSKKVLILSGSPRKNGNSDILNFRLKCAIMYWLARGQIIRRNDSLDKAQVETPAPYSAFFVLLEVIMNILTDKIKTVYFKYLVAAFGSTLISSIYGIVDMAMVGQYHGPEGSAAMGVFAPLWNIIYSFGLLAGIGGSVLFSNIRGEDKGNEKKSVLPIGETRIFGRGDRI